MSTFDGFIKEFPNITIDYFRLSASRPPPSACFLSHVHSDHLLGLETLKMPFVYCSATTRRLLLNIEKYPHRINFAKGILESRKQHYKHLKLILRALPLQTSVELELGPKSKIRVTLLDANHCPGAVMFLIEGNHSAVLYTGDIRAETWWVNSIVQNPMILPYASGRKRLDCIYLDTTFASQEDRYMRFPSKAEGLTELIDKVSKYPSNTTFYFRAWTLGYEQVWIALCNFLRSQVHVDDYQLRLFKAITENSRDGYSMFEAPSLAGFLVGNQEHPGCLTRSRETTIHSCEPGSFCHSQLKEKDVVWIQPIISRLQDGTELLELGAGGGGGDLNQTSELELNDIATIEALQSFSSNLLPEQNGIRKLSAALEHARQSRNFKISLDDLDLRIDDQMSLKNFVELISSREQNKTGTVPSTVPNRKARDDVIHFPYSRHSSYEELRYLVSVFRPKDVCACTVDLEEWTEDMSMQTLFGDLCSEQVFHHDQQNRSEAEELRSQREKMNNLKRKFNEDSQESGLEDDGDAIAFARARAALLGEDKKAEGHKVKQKDTTTPDSMSQRPLQKPAPSSTQPQQARPSKEPPPQLRAVRDAFRSMSNGSDLILIDDDSKEEAGILEEEYGDVSQCTLSTSAFDSQLDDGATAGGFDADRRLRIARRKDAYNAALASANGHANNSWEDINVPGFGRGTHTDEEVEL